MLSLAALWASGEREKASGEREKASERVRARTKETETETETERERERERELGQHMSGQRRSPEFRLAQVALARSKAEDVYSFSEDVRCVRAHVCVCVCISLTHLRAHTQ